MRLMPLLFGVWLGILSCTSPVNNDDLSGGTIPGANLADTVLERQSADLYAKGEKLKVTQKDSALSAHLSALGIRERLPKVDSSLIDSYYAIGSLFSEKLKYDMADRYLENGRLAAEKIKLSPRKEIDFYFLSLDCKINLYDFASSNALIQRIAGLIDTNFKGDSLVRARLKHYQAINFYYHGEPQRAIAFMGESIGLIPRSNHKARVAAYIAMAQLHQAVNDHPRAIVFFNQAADQIRILDDDKSDDLGKVYLQKSFSLRDLGQMDSVKFYLFKNLEIRRRINGNKHATTYGAKFSLADFYQQRLDFDSAAYFYQESLISLVKEFNDLDLERNPVPDQTEANPDLINGLVGKARALKQVGRSDLTRLQLSLKTFFLADSVFYLYRNNFLYDDVKLRQLEAALIPYNEMVEIAFAVFEMTKETKALNMAFMAMERSRAVLLQSSLSKAEAYSLVGVDSTLSEKERSLNQRRAELIDRLDDLQNNEAMRDSLSGAVLSLSGEILQLQKTLQAKNPGYVNLKYASSEANISRMQGLMVDRNSILVEYLWSDSIIYVLVLGKKIGTVKRLVWNESLKRDWRRFATALRINPDDIPRADSFISFCESSHALYDFLLKDLIDNTDIDKKPNLVISADGPLASLPFEALLTTMPKSEEVNYKLPYLVNNFKVSYTYSSGLLLQQAKDERHGTKLLAMGFAGDNERANVRNNLAGLPGTVLEIKSIKHVMKNDVNRYYLESDASEKNFKQQVRDFNIVHLALHGEGDTLDAIKSKLIFRNDADSSNDGKLYAHELYNLDFANLDLAVLSACESGVGKLQAGEGVMSIARGFAYAGCPSLVFSLWKINDQAAADIMGSFYQHLSGGASVDESLSLAKTDYVARTNQFNSHPVYWAAFLAVGDPRALPSKWPSMWVAFGSVLILGVVVFLWKGKKRTRA